MTGPDVRRQVPRTDAVLGSPDGAVAVLADPPPTASSLRPVVGATGVLLPSDLGRASLSQAEVAGGPCR